ncbi:hypothetical protein CAPTEDRAFT_213751 [Capitella teleta]|uniref:DDE-1 domain-containing protein n=1 Tax=Capitella teleta TaxID=283909 RepID=R7V122_CAPTE|nr:hypothetical protein CAPTEDRAFT_213751 [Capitella teleta]|eukprot:ELU12214.1 hypothetical protein CAPTEDRAFT_213751 [Capitella teleta]
MSKLFVSYCSSFYGSQLWKLGSASAKSVCVQWNKGAIMVRNKKRKTDNHGQTEATTMKTAVEKVFQGRACTRYVQKAKQSNSTDIRMAPNYDNKFMFTAQEEHDDLREESKASKWGSMRIKQAKITQRKWLEHWQPCGLAEAGRDLAKLDPMGVAGPFYNVSVLTFPPHCSHKLQPLDLSVYGPLKKYNSAACGSWMMNHPGTPMTIYDIAGNLGVAYPKAFTPSNITKGFEASGIYPFKRNIFDEHEFLSSFVTDRECAIVEADQGNHENTQPYPKAAPRKTKPHHKKRRGSSRVLTDTPVKESIEAEILAKKTKCPRGKKRLVQEATEAECADDPVPFDDLRTRTMRLEKMKRDKSFVGVLVHGITDEGTIQVKFMKQVPRKDSMQQLAFVFPEVVDNNEVDLGDVVSILPTPVPSCGTSRAAHRFLFQGFDFKPYF